MRRNLVVLVCLAACRTATPETGEFTWLPRPSGGCTPAHASFIAGQRDSLSAHDPREDATEALSRGDSSLIAVQGYSLYVPGLGTSWDTHARTYGIRTLLGTAELLCDSTHGAFQGEASEWAGEYNAVVITALQRARQ